MLGTIDCKLLACTPSTDNGSAESSSVGAEFVQAAKTAASHVANLSAEQAQWLVQLVQKNLETTLAETEKWQFIASYFADGIDAKKLRQKMGKCLNHISPLMAITAASLASWGIRVVWEEETGQEVDKSDIEKHTETFVANLAIPIILFFGINWAVKYISRKIERKEVRCSELLAKFVANWDKNKLQTPTSLHPLFDGLNREFIADGKFTKTNAAAAYKIVENVVTTALAISSIK